MPKKIRIVLKQAGKKVVTIGLEDTNWIQKLPSAEQERTIHEELARKHGTNSRS